MTLKSLSKAILYFLILLVVFWGKDFVFNTPQNNFLHSAEPIFSGYSPISKRIFELTDSLGIINYIISMLLIMVNSFYISRIILRFNSNTPKSYLSAIIFLCLISINFITKNNVISHLITFFLLNSSEKQLFVQKGYSTIKYAYFAALNLGLVSILAPIYYCFFIIMLITHLISSTVSFREISASLFGVLTPLFFTSYFAWLTNNEFWSFSRYIAEFYSESFLRISLFLGDYNTYQYIFVFLLLILCIIGSITFIRFNIHNNTKFEYTYYQFLTTSVLGIVLLIPFFSTTATLLPAIIIGLTSVLSMMIVQTQKKAFRIAIISTILIFSLALNLFNTIDKLL